MLIVRSFYPNGSPYRTRKIQSPEVVARLARLYARHGYSLTVETHATVTYRHMVSLADADGYLRRPDGSIYGRVR